MERVEVRDLGEGRQMMDLGFRETEGLVASFVLPLEQGLAVVETGPTTCVERLEHGLAALGHAPSEVRQIFVSHIHLDHAGGLGAAATRFPNATLYAHERGVPHLVDPARLVASARRAWGASADPIWGAILPVPAPRIVALRGGESFPLARGRLEVLATPGHASHHLSFFDTATDSLLSGDSMGVRLEGAPWPRPAVPPPDLDLELLFDSLDRMEAHAPRRILYTHFGPSLDAAEDFRTYRVEVRAWRDAALEAAREEPSVAHVARALRLAEERRLAGRAPSAAASTAEESVSGFEMAAQGFLRYFERRGLLVG